MSETSWLGLTFQKQHRRPADDSRDPFRLFDARSDSMGFRSNPSRGGPTRAWSPEEAGLHESTDSDRAVLWAQVALERPSSGPLPIEGMTSCLADVAARIDLGNLLGCEIVVPTTLIDVGSDLQFNRDVFGVLAGSHMWFEGLDQRRTAFEMVVSGNSEGSLTTATTQVVEWLSDFRQSVLTFDSTAVAPPGMKDRLSSPSRLRGAPAREHVLMRGTVSEWSPMSVGWCMSALVHSYVRAASWDPLCVLMTRDIGD